jgi:hypothetical protein
MNTPPGDTPENRRMYDSLAAGTPFVHFDNISPSLQLLFRVLQSLQDLVIVSILICHPFPQYPEPYKTTRSSFYLKEKIAFER